MDQNEIDYIRSILSESELLAQLAEECAELGQAALKYRRALTGCNPTPISKEDAEQNLIEECADVELCIAALSNADRRLKMLRITDRKCARWVSRLQDNSYPPNTIGDAPK